MVAPVGKVGSVDPTLTTFMGISMLMMAWRSIRRKLGIALMRYQYGNASTNEALLNTMIEKGGTESDLQGWDDLFLPTHNTRQHHLISRHTDVETFLGNTARQFVGYEQGCLLVQDIHDEQQHLIDTVF